MTTLAVTGAIQRGRAMTDPLASTIHFRSSFELRAATSEDAAWSRLIKSVRHWVESSPQKSPPTTNEAFFAAWFFLGGEWRAPGPQYRIVKTSRLIGNGDDQAPEFWAMRYEHSGDDTGRTWRTDVGVVRTEAGAFQMSIVVSHYMREGYIGREPAAPLPTSPRLVGWLLSSSEWEAFAGALRLCSNPAVLKGGDGEEFRRLLEDPERLGPIVLVSRDFKTGEFLIDPGLLSRKLAGAAAVYESESSLLDKELEWCLGGRFSCWNGMVRVYQPGLRFDSPGSARRQRFFSGREIVQQGVGAIVEMLVRGVARRAEIARLPALASIDDIAAIERERRMAELKARATDKNQAEWVQLLESTNADLEKSNRENDNTISQLRSENADLNDTISRLEYDKKSIQHRAREAEQKCAGLQSRADAIDGLRRLPESMREVVDLVLRIHPGRIAFTDQALRTADECEFDNMHDAWSCLWAMATTLYDLLFDPEEGGNIEQRFQDASGFSLIMREGGMTRNDNRLMRLRHDVYKDAAIDITPHVRLDKGTTRAYFCPYCNGGTRLVVVGHIGHLDTAGTRRRKNR